MVWGQKNSFCLLIILHGLFCDGLIHLECSTETCQCGDTVTVTCASNYPLGQIQLKDVKNNVTLDRHLPSKNEFVMEDRKISIEGTEKEVKITIPDVKFSDTSNYRLRVNGPDGNDQHRISIKVTGICKTKIIKREETKELICEAETEKMASIVWIDHHRKIYPSTETKKMEKLTYFKLWSSLKLSEEIEDIDIYCSVCYPDGTCKESHYPATSETTSPQKGNKSTNVTIVVLLLPVALVAAAFGYILKRRHGKLMRPRSLSQGPLMEKAPEEEEENMTHPPLVPPV